MADPRESAAVAKLKELEDRLKAVEQTPQGQALIADVEGTAKKVLELIKGDLEKFAQETVTKAVEAAKAANAPAPSTPPTVQ